MIQSVHYVCQWWW